jgi:hypothetical protein
MVTAHGSDVLGYNPHRFTLLHRVLGPVWRMVARNAAAIVCLSASVQRLVRNACPDASTALIPNGIEPGRFDFDRPKLDRNLVVTRMLSARACST